VENQAGQGVANTSKSPLKGWQRKIVAKVMPMTQRSQASSANSSEKALKTLNGGKLTLKRDLFVT
jgi:hypothetical protein